MCCRWQRMIARCSCGESILSGPAFLRSSKPGASIQDRWFFWLKTTKGAERIELDGAGLHWGMGYHTRANIEPVLLATRGNPQRMAKDVHQVVVAPVGKHSEKPDEIYRRIEGYTTALISNCSVGSSARAGRAGAMSLRRQKKLSGRRNERGRFCGRARMASCGSPWRLWRNGLNIFQPVRRATMTTASSSWATPSGALPIALALA